MSPAMSVGGTRNGGGSVYAGVSCWNPGDGSGTMDDPLGMENAKILGKRIAILAKKMN